MDNYLLVAVGILIVVCMIVGFAKGLIRIAVSLGATIITIVLVAIATPYVGQAIVKYTPMEDVIEQAFVGMITPQLEEIPEDAENYEELKELLESKEIPLKDQIAAINGAEIPEFLKQALLDNNNKEVYSMLGVDKFVDYVGAYISKMIINIISFLVTFIIITILVRMTVFSLDFITELPILHGVNRLAGGAVGIIMALMIVWVIFLVVTLIYGTKTGQQCFEWIEQSNFLTFLYNNNLILKAIIGF